LDPFPDDVRLFLEAHIDSIEQLETLRILDEDRGREWRADEIASQVQTTPELAHAHLAALQGRGVLTCVQREGGVYCRYGPHSAELEGQLQRLLELYRQRPVTMIRMVYALPPSPLRTFSDAFRLRKEQ
jgi:hypothetical protein